WDNGRGEIAVVFGDTYKYTNTTDPALAFADHRRNVIGFSTSRDEGRLAIARMVEDRPGHAGEIIGKTPGVDPEPSVIPTAGIAIGPRNSLFFMSVKDWKTTAGVWTTNYSSIAFSDDGGEHWTRSDARWPDTSRFAQTALALDGDYLYVLGT